MRFETRPPSLDSLLPLYESVGWTAYVRDPAGLERAVANSTYVVAAWEGERLVGLARAISDEASVWFLQDLLVHPDRQRDGLGSALIERCAARFAEVRRGVLLTDPGSAEPFYEKHGWKSADGLGMTALVRDRGRSSSF